MVLFVFVGVFLGFLVNILRNQHNCYIKQEEDRCNTLFPISEYKNGAAALTDGSSAFATAPFL